MLEELRGGEPTAVTQLDNFGNVLHHVDDLHLLVELKPILRVVAETDGLADVQRTAVGLHQPHQYLDEGRFARSVVAHDTHLLVAGEDVGEIVQYLQVAESLAQVVGLEYLVADVGSLDVELHVGVVEALLGHLLQFVEGLLAVAGLVAAGLGHAAHPLQLGAVQVVGALHLHRLGVDALLPLLQVVAVVSLVGINRAVIYLDDFGADTVEEVAVVRHHEQCQVRPSQVFFQPLGHVEVEVVGGLVEDEEIGLGDEGIGQRHTLQLPAGEVLHLLVEVAYLQLGKYLLGLLLVVPRLFVVHVHEQLVQAGMTLGLHAAFVVLDEVHGRVAMMETGFEYGQFFGIRGTLFKIAHTKISAKGYLSLVVTLLSREDVEQGGLAASVLGNQSDTLAFGQAEGYIFKQDQVAERLGEIFYLQYGRH